jgi:hypothetical protein
MASYYVSDMNVSGIWSLSSPNKDIYAFVNGQNPLASPSYANNPIKRGANNSMDSLAGSGIGASTFPPAPSLSGDLVVFENQHTDYHFRLWAIPTVLQLSNPQLNADIPIRLWNTNPIPETVTSVLVSGSSVLTFDLSSGDTIRDYEFRKVNMQIGPGEPTVDAIVSFSTTNLSASVRVLALVSDTFNLIPDVPVKEIWEFKTDILTNYKGVEQRIALRRYPRIEQQFDVEILDLRQRRNQYNVAMKNIAVQSLIPFYQFGTNITKTSVSGSNRIYFDPVHSNMRVDEFLVIVNPTTEEIHISKISSIETDGAIINSTLGFDISPHWVVAPALNCTINNGSGIDMRNVTGKLSISAKTFNEPPILRPGATRSMDSFDGVPWINRRPNIRAKEDFSFRRYIIDNEIGARDINSNDKHPRISGDRVFTIQRMSDPEEMDYWRDVFETLRGSQKSFLLSTWFPDLSLSEPYAVGASTIKVNEGYYPEIYFLHDSWKRIQLEFENNVTSQHTVTSAVTDTNGKCSISLSPSIPADSDHLTPVRISFLQRWRATDRVAFKHYANYSEISFGVVSSDE